MRILKAHCGLRGTCDRDENRDRSIAKHVMSVHINASGVNASAQEGDIDIATMKKFVSYCRLKCSPRLSEAAATMLSSQVQRGNDTLTDAQQPQNRPNKCFASFHEIFMVPFFLFSSARCTAKNTQSIFLRGNGSCRLKCDSDAAHMLYLVRFDPRRRAATNARCWRGSAGGADHGAPTRGQSRASFAHAFIEIARPCSSLRMTAVHILGFPKKSVFCTYNCLSITKTPKRSWWWKAYGAFFDEFLRETPGYLAYVLGDRHSSVSPNHWRRCVFRPRYPRRTSRRPSGCSKFPPWLPPRQDQPRGIWGPSDRRLSRKCGEQRTS